jgi:hypothetical protein
MIGRLGWLTLWAVACSGPTDDKDLTDTDDTQDDDDVTEETGTPPESTPEGPEFFEPAFFIVESEFGWDSTTRQLVDISTPYGSFVPIIRLLYGSAGWEAEQFTFDSDNYCEAQLLLTQSTASPRFQDDPAAWLGFDLPADAAIATDCNLGDGQYDFDPDIWGPDPIGDLLTREWGVGVGEIVPSVYDQWAGGDYADSVFGGIILNTELPYGHNEYSAFNREIDASFAVILDEDLQYSLLPSTSISLGDDNIATGWYLIIGGGVWSFQ